MKSMTGYGKGCAESGGRQLTIELKSVNNRYLEINSRLPKSLACCDETVRKVIQKKLARGSVEVYFNDLGANDDAKRVTVDMALAREYVAAAKKLRTEFLLDEDFQTTALLRSPEVVRIEATRDDPELLIGLVKAATEQAADELNRMRETEGDGIRQDLKRLIGHIVSTLEQVIARAPKVVADYRTKLKSRMTEILAGVAVDENMLLNEVAFFADKADINEEISRLTSHINQFVACLDIDEPQGRKLDFLSQEMNREINTMGSKSNDVELTNCVVAMKNELEKIKEQIRNVE